MRLEDDDWLRGKGVLLIAPRFFGYEQQICSAIDAAGGTAFYLDERPGNDFVSKGLVRINADLVRTRIKRYYAEHVARIDGDMDYVLIISPEAINSDLVKWLRQRFKSAKFVLYMWDSIKNKNGTNNALILPHFDRVFSFDQNDCKEYPNMTFRALFFIDAYAGERIGNADEGYDLAFIGSGHSDRYRICRRIKEQIDRAGRRTFFFLYLHSRQHYRFLRATNPAMRGSKSEDFAYVPLSPVEVSSVLSRSKAILDIQHQSQNGLTMRSIEVLGLRKKLVTTNKAIQDYDFYRPENIYCLDRELGSVPLDWLDAPYVDLPPEIYTQYSVSAWLREIVR